MPYQALILMVCTANICRSPMAEQLLRRLIERAGDAERLRVASAGIWVLPDQPASTLTCQILAEEGLDLSAHRSRSLSQQAVDEAALILVMTRVHKEDICLRFLRAEGKVYLLSEMVGKTFDIEDPFGGPLEAYQQSKAEIEDLLTRGYKRICKLALGQDAGARRWRF